MNSSSDTNEQRISELVTAYRILLNEQVLDSFGHVSVRSATDPDRFFMPRAMPPSLVTSDDVLEYRVTDSQPADRSTRSARERRALSARRNRRLILPAPLDVLIDEGAKAIVVMGFRWRRAAACNAGDCATRLRFEPSPAHAFAFTQAGRAAPPACGRFVCTLPT